MTINNQQKDQNTINALIFLVLITIGSMILIEILVPNLEVFNLQYHLVSSDEMVSHSSYPSSQIPCSLKTPQT